MNRSPQKYVLRPPSHAPEHSFLYGIKPVYFSRRYTNDRKNVLGPLIQLPTAIWATSFIVQALSVTAFYITCSHVKGSVGPLERASSDWH